MLRARLVTRRVPAPTATARASAFRARAPHRRGGAPGLTVQAASPCAARGARDAAATVLPHGVPTLPRRPVPRGTPGRDPLYNPTRRHAAARAVCRRSSESYRPGARAAGVPATLRRVRASEGCETQETVDGQANCSSQPSGDALQPSWNSLQRRALFEGSLCAQKLEELERCPRCMAGLPQYQVESASYRIRSRLTCVSPSTRPEISVGPINAFAKNRQICYRSLPFRKNTAFKNLMT